MNTFGLWEIQLGKRHEHIDTIRLDTERDTIVEFEGDKVVSVEYGEPKPVDTIKPERVHDVEKFDYYESLLKEPELKCECNCKVLCIVVAVICLFIWSLAL